MGERDAGGDLMQIWKSMGAATVGYEDEWPEEKRQI